MTDYKNRMLLFLKGMGMGGADVVPGVSGGTIAFITGIYEELLDSIKSFDLEALKLLKEFRLADFWQKINGNFLLVLFAGIGVSVLTISELIGTLLKDHPIQLWSFFFGLIIISAILVARTIKSWNYRVVLFLIAGTILAYFVTSFSPAKTSTSYPFIFLSGAVAICAMILPGISGSFILLILGKYEFIINAVTERKLGIIIVFAAGCAIGLLSFARLLSWALKRWHDIMVAFLSGFMIGSLNKIWPWKRTLETYVDRHDEVKPLVQENVSPQAFESTIGDPHLTEAILFSLGAVVVVFLIDLIARRQSK